MNISVQTETLYKSSGFFRLIPHSGYNFESRNKPFTKENMPSYTGNLFNFLTSGNEDQQFLLSQLWRYLTVFFPNPDLKNLDRFPMHTFIMDDGAIAVEWHFRNMAIAFDIEEDAEESGWSLSSTPDAGNYAIGGDLSDAASIENAVRQVRDILNQQWDHVSYGSR